ncbi:MAG: hypothetical protein AB1916_16005 [Thermodesulfobacteriota bacterium]
MQTPPGSTSCLLGYDQAGSLKVVAAMEGERGGLRDRFTGLVRFLHRDYDPTVGHNQPPRLGIVPARLRMRRMARQR